MKVFMTACQVYQQMKDRNHNPASLLQLESIPIVVFEKIAMDFITCLLSSKGKATIMTVVDHLSKYGHFIPLASNFIAHSVANVIKLYEPPRVIVLDSDPRFLHSLWQESNQL